MILDYKQIEEQIKVINPLLKQDAHVQKIFSTCFYLALSFRQPGVTRWLYLGRGSGYEGVWVGESAPKSELRTKNQLLEFVRKYVSGGNLRELELDRDDRALQLKYTKWGKENIFSYFWRGRSSYFTCHYYDPAAKAYQLFASWRGKVDPINKRDFFSIFNEVGRKKIEVAQETKKILSISSLLKKEEEKIQQLGSKKRTKRSKFLLKKKKNIEKDILKIEKWPEYERLGLRAKEFSNVEVEQESFKFKLGEYKINFQGLNYYQKVDAIFSKIKKLKKAERILKSRLLETEKQIEEIGDDFFYEKKPLIVRPVWVKEKVESKRQETKYNVAFYNFSFGKVAVGKDAAANDYLRSSWSKKSDIWFHIEGVPSAHLYLKKVSGIGMDLKIIQLLGSCLSVVSKYNSSDVPLLYTEVKNLKGIKGKPGSVIYKKEKHISIHFLEDWMLSHKS